MEYDINLSKKTFLLTLTQYTVLSFNKTIAWHDTSTLVGLQNSKIMLTLIINILHI